MYELIENTESAVVAFLEGELTEGEIYDLIDQGYISESIFEEMLDYALEEDAKEDWKKLQRQARLGMRHSEKNGDYARKQFNTGGTAPIRSKKEKRYVSRAVSLVNKAEKEGRKLNYFHANPTEKAARMLPHINKSIEDRAHKLFGKKVF